MEGQEQGLEWEEPDNEWPQISRELGFDKFYNVLKIPVSITLLGYLYMLLDAQQPTCRHKKASFYWLYCKLRLEEITKSLNSSY